MFNFNSTKKSGVREIINFFNIEKNLKQQFAYKILEHHERNQIFNNYFLVTPSLCYMMIANISFFSLIFKFLLHSSKTKNNQNVKKNLLLNVCVWLLISLFQSPDMQIWQNDYLQGTGCEMYTETLSPSFTGMTFPQACE